MRRSEKQGINSVLYEEVAEELNLRPEQIQDIVIEGQGKFIKHIIETSLFDTVTMPYLGKIKANFRKVQAVSHAQGKVGQPLIIKSIKTKKK